MPDYSSDPTHAYAIDDGLMANTMYKEWFVISAATLDKKTGKWIARITINHTTHPPGSFDTEKEAEAFGLKFATALIDAKTK